MGGSPASSNENYNGSVNNMSAINLGGAIRVNGNIGNGDVTQNGNSSATGGSYNFGVTANLSAPSGDQMPGLQELVLTPAQAACHTWFDGCNTCHVMGDAMACTKMMCFVQQEPKCLDEQSSYLMNMSIDLSPNLSGHALWDSGEVNEGGIGHVHLGDHSVYCGIGVKNADCPENY